MATDLRNLLTFFTNDADFRAWGSGIAAQIAAATGLVKTSDTGQINWATVTRPAAGSFAGYEIWRFNDALQATKPVFIKLEYGAFPIIDQPDFPCLRVRVGTASNGAGTLSGQLGTMVQNAASNAKSAGVTLPSYCSGSTSRLSLWTNVDVTNNTFAIGVMIERTKTAAGVDTGDGIITKVGGRYQAFPFTGTVPTQSTLGPAATLTGSLSKVGGSVALSPTIAALGQAFFASWVAYLQADLTALASFQADHLGATRTLMPIGGGLNPGGLVQGDTTGHSLALLWE